LFSNKQYGFFKGRSTVQRLLKVFDEWTEKLENGCHIEVLYIDLEKAFDRVPHKRLLRKLKSFNLHPDLIDWIKLKVQVKALFIYIADRKASAYSCRFFCSACFQLRTTTGTLLLIQRPLRVSGRVVHRHTKTHLVVQGVGTLHQ